MDITIDNGKIRFNGQDFSPQNTSDRLGELEAAYRRIKRQVSEKAGITIQAVMIERHFAASLFNYGHLTPAMLEASSSEFGGFTFNMRLDGDDVKVSIQERIFYDAFEFLVTGHPDSQTTRVKENLGA